MSQIFNMAIKDLRILFRDKLGAFFIVVFPVLMGLFFGLMMGNVGGNGGSSKMNIAIVDQDNSEMSAKFTESLAANESVNLVPAEYEDARQSVRAGKRQGMIVLPEGFGANVGVFWGEPATIQIGMDPSRMAESGMLQGFVMQSVGEMAGQRFTNPSGFKPVIEDSRKQLEADEAVDPVTRVALNAFFNSVDGMLENIQTIQDQGDEEDSESGNAVSGNGFQFADIEEIDITYTPEPGSRADQISKITSRWDISFPQAMLWGIFGCVAGFAISIAQERTQGTMVRLQAAPVSKIQVLGGKALACFLTVLLVITALTILGVLLPDGLSPDFPKLAVAAVCVAICFVGIMMTFSVLGKSEQSVSGIGWAANMVMAMLGGCMIPVMFMPDFIQKFSVISPAKWAILALEGAVWRQFSFAELTFPCGILLAIGIAGFAIGTFILNRRGAT